MRPPVYVLRYAIERRTPEGWVETDIGPFEWVSHAEIWIIDRHMKNDNSEYRVVPVEVTK